MRRRQPDHESENPDLRPQDGVSEGIESLPKRVTRYGAAKTKALDVAQYIRSSPHAQALRKNIERLQCCGDYLVFRHYYTVDQVKLHGARLCKQHLLCPLCAIRRGAKYLKAYLDRFDLIRAESPTLRPYLVTLTVKDGPDLLERFTHLHRSQRELWMRRHRGRGSVLDVVVGAVWSYEVKRGSGSRLWHPHLHMVALAEVMPDHSRLSAEWRSITRDSYIVDVRPIDPGDPATGFVEVFKYAVKFSDQPEEDTLHAYLTLRGRRFLSSAGCFRGVPEPDDLLDDAEALEGLPYATLFYRYLSRGYTLAST